MWLNLLREGWQQTEASEASRLGGIGDWILEANEESLKGFLSISLHVPFDCNVENRL